MSATVRALVILVAAIGFLFDTYELLMFPVIGTDAVAELLFRKSAAQLTTVEQQTVSMWAGRMLWIAALCGGVFGLIGGLLIDRFGRKTVMVASILVYSLSPVFAAFSGSLWMLILFRCTTFIGVCVEMVAAVTWLAELFDNKRTREMVIGWTLAAASLGGIFVTLVYNYFVEYVKTNPAGIPNLPFPDGSDLTNLAWRYTLLTGLIPGLLILVLLPFVPESKVWKERKANGTLSRPKLSELFAPSLIRTTIVTTVLSACSYAAAFGALQLTPLRIIEAHPSIAKDLAEGRGKVVKSEKAWIEAKAAGDEATIKETNTAYQAAKKEFVPINNNLKKSRGNIQLYQEIGGLLGRILLAILLMFLPSRTLLRCFLIPGIILLPLTYYYGITQPIFTFSMMIFFCGLLTVAQFSYMSEFLPRVFPVHLRGTGGGFATNVGGRMIGTMAATLNTGLLSTFFAGSPPMQIALAAACIGCAVYLIAFVMSFFLPEPEGHSA